MKRLITIAAFSLLSSTAFGLSETHCSNADGSIKRVEQEIWGTNLVEWSMDGQKLAGDEIVMLAETEVSLSVEKSLPNTGMDDSIETFAVKVMLPSGDQAFVICRRWENSAVD